MEAQYPSDETMLPIDKKDFVASTANRSLADLDKTQKCHTDLERLDQMFVELSTFWYCFLALITTVGLIVSLVSNIIIIYLFTSISSLRKNSSNIVAVNLSLSDLLYCTQWPSVIYCCLTQSTWILDHKWVCQSFGFITVSTALASILTVLVMSVERAIVIVYSVHARDRFTTKSAWLIIVLIWFLSLSSCLPPLFGKFNRYTLDPSKTSCTLLYVAYWIAPAVVISISYILIIFTFKSSSMKLRKISGDREVRVVVSHPTRFVESLIVGRQRRQEHNTNKLTITPSSRSSKTVAKRCDSSELDPNATSRLSLCNRWTKNLQKLPTDKSSFKFPEEEISALDKPPTVLADKFKRFKGASIKSYDSSNISSAVDESRGITCLRSNLGGSLNRGSTSSGPTRCSNSSSRSANSNATRTVLQFRLAMMSFYLIMLWVVSWTPIASLAMINSVVDCHTTSATAVFLASTMTKLGPAFDVFIYGISHPKIKSRFKRIIKQLLMLGNSKPSNSGAT